MNIQPQQTNQSISDDQELAKVLAGVDHQADEVLQFEKEATQPVIIAPTPVVSSYSAPVENLENIKKDALIELRPLVEKLNLTPEEKFDTYLLLLRSTDDKTLIAPAHLAAQAIADETRRAQALLDVIKEIDYLSPPQQ